MSEEIKKIEEVELSKVTEQQQRLSEALTNIGVLDVQKLSLHTKVKEISDEIEATKKELEAKYGKINIDLKDGSYTDIEKTDGE